MLKCDGATGRTAIDLACGVFRTQAARNIDEASVDGFHQGPQLYRLHREAGCMTAISAGAGSQKRMPSKLGASMYARRFLQHGLAGQLKGLA